MLTEICTIHQLNFTEPKMSNEKFNSELSALNQADSDMQKENLDNLKKKKVSPDAFLEQQALIGRLIKAGIQDTLKCVDNISL